MPPTADDLAPPANNALLKSIQKGAKLKKAVTNDKSAPILDSKSSANASSGGDKQQPSIDAVKQKLGGMFGGMPALGTVQLKPVNRGSKGMEDSRPPLKATPPTLPVIKPSQAQETPVPRPPPLRTVAPNPPPPVPATRPKPSSPDIPSRKDVKAVENGWTFEVQLPGPKKPTGRSVTYPSKPTASPSPDKVALKERKREIEKLREEMKKAASREDFVLAQELKHRITELEGAQ